MVANGSSGGCDSCRGDAKWFVLVDDKAEPMPRKHVVVRLVKSQVGVADGRRLVRDHNSPEDVVLDDDQEIDLAEGNVFYTLPACEIMPRGECRSAAKLAWSVDDRVEVTTRAEQTGKSLRDLFGLATNSSLVRDYESPHDMPIEIASHIVFREGPVFHTRTTESKLRITVNARLFSESDGVKSEMLGQNVAALVYPENPKATRVYLVSDGNQEIPLNSTVRIHGCEVFDVVRCNVDGGYESLRIERELDQIRSGGQQVTFLSTPQPCVIYHGLRTRPGYPVESSDVLVPVPSGYPGSEIDWAYLPENSPLIGKVKGSPQEPRVSAAGILWRQISYHPHRNGGAPAWNPARHGFHTYLGELLSWLYAAN